MIKTLPAANGDSESSELRFAAAAVLTERAAAGLRLLLALLGSPSPAVRRALPQLLKLLAACCAVRACRRRLLEVGALRVLLHLVHAACKPLLEAEQSGAASSAGSSSGALDPDASATSSGEEVEPAAAVAAAAAEGAEGGAVVLGGGWLDQQLLELLRMLESLANESNATPAVDQPASGSSSAGTATAAAAQPPAAVAAAAGDADKDVAVDVCQLARGLALLERHGLGGCSAVLARLLTALARSDAAAQRGLLDFFAPALDLSALDAAATASFDGEEVVAAAAAGRAVAGGGAAEQRLQLQGLLKLTEALTTRQGAGPSGGDGAAAAVAAEAVAVAPAADCGFRQLVLARGIPGQLAAYLVSCFAEAQQQGAGGSAAAGAAPTSSGGGAAEAAAPGGARRPGEGGEAPAGQGAAGGRGEEAEEEQEDEGHEWMFGTSPAPSSPQTPRLLQQRTPPRDAGADRRRPQRLSVGGAAVSPAGTPPPAARGGAASEPRPLFDPAAATWQSAVRRPGVAFALQLLTALARGHGGVAAGLAGAPGLLSLAHALEGVHGGRDLAPLAEGLLEAVAASGGDEAAEAVYSMRAATKVAMRAAAARKREEMLSKMGMVQVRTIGCGRAVGKLVSFVCFGLVDRPRPFSPPLLLPTISQPKQVSGEFPGSASTPRIAPSPASVPALSPLAAELAVLDEEGEDEPEALCCMVCREGYALQPASLLGVYAFTRAAPADEFPGCGPPPAAGGGSSGGSSSSAVGSAYGMFGGGLPAAGGGAIASVGSILTTVSHFNLIHASCHASARAADASLRQPKREWEGAALRNGEVLCNCLVPLRGGATTETAYVATAAAMWEAQTNAASCGGAAAAAAGSRRAYASIRAADSTAARLALTASDAAALLRRFAWRLSFSSEARGGGRGSNARLLLGLLQLGRYYAQQLHTAERRAHADLLAAALDAGKAALAAGSSDGSGGSSSGARPPAEAHAPHVFALSLLLQSPEEWAHARGPMLALAVRHSVALAAADRGSSAGGSGSSSAAEELSADELFLAAAPGVRLFGLADALQGWCKPARGATAGGWARAMAQRLADLRACEEGAGQLLEQLEELEEAADVQEALDVMGALGLAIGQPVGGAGGGVCASAGEWLRRVAGGGAAAAAAAAASVEV